jgi:hypothetical protein
MATRLATAKRGIGGLKVERRPHFQPIRGMTERFDFIDTEPKARSRQAANIGDSHLD